ncbi:acyl-CoA synthetase [Desulfosarcina ovata subsp. sediminis]|uniref:Acyl-CoA synthetase n=1 Tax=Desulfosarcina ovata subsp. sediminis TaxID=885957 RepID=A0A5K7ZGH8_9BACT|nr:acetate--CoA ligase family protein [Desulfosarcina ovata]BBO80066.1 acyl-CoA synthetase [Desulfosarcina ovata subsp. sediminis]
METHEWVRKALASGRRALTETESKTILGGYGVPVVTETIVSTADEAVATARQIGFPVVIKGIGENLLHKTESGVVHLNLNDAAAVSRAAGQILNTLPEIKILVQPQVVGQRELVAGIFRDPHFGPAVLFGLGGIFTEALSDVVLRLAPLTREDALDMIESVRSRRLLDAFRGEAAVDRESLVGTLMGLSAIATDIPEIAEIDINPFIAAADGTLAAVDALITLADPDNVSAVSPPVPPPAIHAFFHPRSVAFIGASSQMGKWGHTLLCNTISCGYQGEIYTVNPKGGVIAGKPAFKQVGDIPGPVDLAVVTVPAAGVMDLIPQLEAKGVRNMLLVTSGFGEIGSEGKRLERQLVDAARDAGILVLGPNTMGIGNPHIHFSCMATGGCSMAGTTAVVSQSGNMGAQLLAFAEKQGIGIRAFSGSGNEAMLTIEDYMEGFEVDPLTETVMLYIESVKNGRRFFESARRVSRKKPIVLLKGGQTDAGRRAAASHTGAMASDVRLFDAMCRQAGIVKVDQSMELLDLSAGFASLPLIRGNRIAIMTLGGGWGVITSDMCNRFNLEVPELPAALIARIDKILPTYWSRTNPVDLVGENDLDIPLSVLEALLEWDGCDGVINLGIFGRRFLVRRLADSVARADDSYTRKMLEETVRTSSDFEKRYIREIVRLMEKFQKPIFGVSILTEENDSTVYPVDGHDLKAIFFETPERAVKTAARMAEYRRYLSRGY